MKREYNVKDMNLKVDDIIPFTNDKRKGFTIEWSSDTEFGEYRIVKSKYDDKWCGESGFRDTNDNKEFISELMRLFIDQLRIR